MAIDLNSFKTYPVQYPTVTKPVETKSPQANSKMNTITKVATGSGIVALAAVGIYIATKGKVSKTLSEKELGKIQRNFKDMFMRDDISVTETKQILGRYKEIEKIEDKEEFIKALYKEAKQNYGFGDIDLPLIFKEGQVSAAGTTYGAAHVNMSSVELNPSMQRNKVFNAVHHELRHIKQDYYAANLDKEGYFDAIIENSSKSIDISLTNDEIIDIREVSINEAEKIWGHFSPEKVPSRYKEFARICIDGAANYVDAHKDKKAYMANFLEIDAYKAGSMIDNVMNIVKDKNILR